VATLMSNADTKTQLFDSIRPDRDRMPASGWRRTLRWLRRQLPTGLYARSVLIIILPMVILQVVVAYVFMERHWAMVTERLSSAVTRDIAAIIQVMETYPQDKDYSNLVRIAGQQLELEISVEPNGTLPPPRPKPFFSILDDFLSQQIARRIQRPFWIDTVGNSRVIEIRILVGKNVLRIFAPRGAAYASNTHIFLLWMLGTSLVLIGISILFLRGQIRPILSLARAAESFGKGQKMPGDFAPRGADEIRRASLAFILMRERIERHVEQRTAMLTGVSHDLRTILTRFKLQLALMGDNKDLEPLSKDVADMQSMLEGYMAFARGEAEEDVGTMKLSELFKHLEMEAELEKKTFKGEIEGDDELHVRPNAFSRLVSNLTSNAWRHANTVHASARHSAKWLTLTIDDDGLGIPEDMREDVFKPFFRLDAARNLNSSGTGLGLSIARDIANSHGGSVTLGDSPLGGLRAIVRIPA
jgi:two-component system, OmpR family, osmolarity sensor histidine kinase EnvZ